jgi:hypothetical protein
MMGYVIAFAGGMMVGTFFGLLTAAMCVAASDADRKAERWEGKDGKRY